MNVNDLFPFLDGLDISVNISIIVYLCSFFLPLLDTRIAIILMSLIIFLSFSSRIFDLKISNLFQGTKLEMINILIILPFLYLFPLLIQESFPAFISISIFLFSRVMIGIFFSLSYRGLNINEENQEMNLSLSKFWVFFFGGLVFGFFLFSIVNEIYSNNFLNEGGWKLLYIILIFIVFILYIFTKYFFKNSIKLSLKINVEKNIEKNKEGNFFFFLFFYYFYSTYNIFDVCIIELASKI